MKINVMRRTRVLGVGLCVLGLALLSFQNCGPPDSFDEDDEYNEVEYYEHGSEFYGEDFIDDQDGPPGDRSLDPDSTSQPDHSPLPDEIPPPPPPPPPPPGPPGPPPRPVACRCATSSSRICVKQERGKCQTVPGGCSCVGGCCGSNCSDDEDRGTRVCSTPYKSCSTVCTEYKTVVTRRYCRQDWRGCNDQGCQLDSDC